MIGKKCPECSTSDFPDGHTIKKLVPGKYGTYLKNIKKYNVEYKDKKLALSVLCNGCEKGDVIKLFQRSHNVCESCECEVGEYKGYSINGKSLKLDLECSSCGSNSIQAIFGAKRNATLKSWFNRIIS